jgi:glutaredoxin-related protein
MQKVENLGIALNFIQNEGIQLVNIGPSDLADGNINLILGLIWTLILRFEINAGGGDGEGDLLQWVRSKIPEYNINNFQKDWNDGRAVCALIDALVPGLCPDHKSMDRKAKKQNCAHGINTADRNMDIQPLLAPEEMAHPKVHKQAMMTYIAQYRNFRPEDYTNHNDAERCSAFGPGLQEGLVNNQSDFYVDIPSDIKSPLVVRVEGPRNDAKVVIRKEGTKHHVSYTPTVPGEYKVHVTVGGNHIPGSTFFVTVLEEVSLGGEGKIRVYFSTTSSNQKTRRDIQNLKVMLEAKKVHLREDFEPWIPIDVAMDVEDRKLLFAKAGTNTLPMVFIDDKYSGDYDALCALNETGELDRLLNMRGASVISEAQHAARMRGEFSFDSKLESGSTSASPKKQPVTRKSAAPAREAPPARPTSARGFRAPASAPAKTPVKVKSSASRPKFCTECGAKQSGGKFCSSCGNKL